MDSGYDFDKLTYIPQVRQFMNLEEAYVPEGSDGMMATIHVAQDDKSWDELQDDTRLAYDIYDTDLADASKNRRGVDASIPLTQKHWDRMLEVGDLVYGEEYEYLDRDTGIIERTRPEYFAYQSDIIVGHDGPEIVRDTISKLEVPLDIEKHGQMTSDKINEDSPAVQARRAVNERMELEESDTMGDGTANMESTGGRTLEELLGVRVDTETPDDSLNNTINGIMRERIEKNKLPPIEEVEQEEQALPEIDDSLEL